MAGAKAEMWRIAETVAWTESGDDVVALDLVSVEARPLTLQGTAATVWNEVDRSGPITVDDLVRNIATAYSVDDGAVHDDIVALLRRLREHHLLVA
ncbi:PqqD family protein [Microbacterium sp. 22242]|uniref:PqqD family protein n=1 Tax=Microbacterium sp. 22242 TaxID=3453896 RepID=UPI003F875F69